MWYTSSKNDKYTEKEKRMMMRLCKLKESWKLSHFFENLYMLLLGINSENRKKLAQAKAENNIFLYNDILFQALIYDDKRSWWHTDI